VKKKVLTVGLTYTGEAIRGVEIDNFGLCQPQVAPDSAAFALYEYDTIIIYPASFTHFLFGKEGKFSNERYELNELKGENVSYDIDTVFDGKDRREEMRVAIAEGANVVWCLSEPKRQNFYGYRETHMGYLAPEVIDLIKRANLQVKKGRRLAQVNPDSPFLRYFEMLRSIGWTICLRDSEQDGYTSMASTPEGYSIGGSVKFGSTNGWLVTPPTSQVAANQLIRDSIGLSKEDAAQEKYHDIFLSHTGSDKRFVRRLRDDLKAHGVRRVWVDEAEIDIGDSLIAKIDEGMKTCRYIGVVLSPRSVNAPWVQKELDVAINREISAGEVVVLPILYEKCELPSFLKAKRYADFTDSESYDDSLNTLLRRLRIR
jgi:hypothetical protein